MGNVKITIALIAAIVLQWTLHNVAEVFSFVDFPLIIVVYASLQRNSIRALFFGTISGISMDALSGGLLGANGFSKTLTAFVVSEITRRVYMDNLLFRIPIIAGACLLDDLTYYGVHLLLGQASASPLLNTLAYTLIGTTVAGTTIYFFLDSFSTGFLKKEKHSFFMCSRQIKRKNPIQLRKK